MLFAAVPSWILGVFALLARACAERCRRVGTAAFVSVGLVRQECASARLAGKAPAARSMWMQHCGPKTRRNRRKVFLSRELRNWPRMLTSLWHRYQQPDPGYLLRMSLRLTRFCFQCAHLGRRDWPAQIAGVLPEGSFRQSSSCKSTAGSAGAHSVLHPLTA